MNNHIVESDFEYEGCRCVVIGQTAGHRCGYVGINKNNLLYGSNYGDKNKLLKMSNLKNEDIGKRGIIPLLAISMSEERETVSPDCYFNVHGSITYSGGGKNSKYPVDSNLWWFGYDCAHYRDAKDIDLMDETYKKIYESYPDFEDDLKVRTKEYCIDECKILAEQLNKFNIKEK